MSLPPTIHATCVSIDGRGVLLLGPPGAGKSDLALRLIDRGAVLVADDRTRLIDRGGELVAVAPERIAGMLEVRGVGIITLEHEEAPVALAVMLGEEPERMPPEELPSLREDTPVPVISLAAFEASAPLKVELALAGLIAR